MWGETERDRERARKREGGWESEEEKEITEPKREIRNVIKILKQNMFE